jgi:phenylalanyl-tRNA synthetase beta chain
VRVPLAWLRELVPVELETEELIERIGRRGVKVEGVLEPWSGLSGVVVAEVLDVRDHPNSDRLCLARVRTPQREAEVVVGVRNMRPGDRVPWAPPGARVPELDRPLEARAIRGVVSEGMLCSPRELALGAEHEGILVLDDPDLVPGTDLRTGLGLDQPVLDIEVEPNRPDFLSVLGVAREVAAATGARIVEPPAALAETDERASEVASVRIEATDACSRYVARMLRGVRPVASPLWARARLVAAGMRPISAVVDATNYVMLELGQPLHAFDLARLTGPAIVVRYAQAGERLTTLDGVERVLEPEDLLICDASGPAAIAGVMGGATSEVDASTTDVLLESAHFARGRILRTARRLDLHTEASHRFERGTDPEGLDRAAARCAALIAAWTGASVASGVAEAGEVPPRRRVVLRPDRASSVLGYPVSIRDAAGAFAELGLPHRIDGDRVEVEVPGYRVDLEREVDLIEEVLRVQGYDRVGSRLPRAPHPGGAPPAYAFARRLKEALLRAGLREIRPTPFVSADDAAVGGARAVPVANPLRVEEGFLRTSLVPGLARSAARNLDLGARGVALFEVGVVFDLADGVRERRRVGFVLAGAAPAAWDAPERPVDVLDARGVLEAVLADVGVEGWELAAVPDGPWHPGRSAAVRVGSAEAGVLGELHPRAARAFGVEGRVALCELDVAVLAGARRTERTVRETPRVPPVRRDLAFVVPAEVPAGRVRAILTEAGGELLDEAVLFDVYEGPPLPAGRKSLAFAVSFRAPDRTLEGQEVQPIVERIVERIAAEVGGELRTTRAG